MPQLLADPTAPSTHANLFADKLVHNLCALLAFDIAAPVELAVAAFCLHCLELVIAPATAHEFAAIHAFRSLVAEPSLGTQGASALIAHTVIRTGVNVYQVMDSGCIKAAVHLHQLAPGVEFHSPCTVIFLFQSISNLAKVS